MSQNEALVANFLNKYFTGITQTLAAENRDPTVLQTPLINYEDNSTSNSLFIFLITSSEILDSIKAVANKNSIGYDGVRVDILKNCMHSLLEPLGILFNLSVSQGVFPDQLKTAVVVPIHKSGAQTEIYNYRPISIISVLSKILELIVKNRVLAFLNHNGFFSDRQFGFLPSQSTDGALLSHITDIVNNIERGSFAVALYLDIRKVFDTVDHDILLEKLQSCGIRGPTLDWFSSYPRNRYQVMRVGEEFSNPLKITSGVPL